MRRTLLLNDDWLFRRGDISVAEALSLNDGWRHVTLPHDWAIEGPFDGWNEPICNVSQDGKVSFAKGNETGALPYIGCGVYVRELKLGKGREGWSYRLEFDGVMSHSTVIVNGTVVGGRSYGYSSFACDISKCLHFNGMPNRIVVRVENPPYLSRWYPGAGIYRDARLVMLPPRHFAYQGIKLKTVRLDCERRCATLETTADGFLAEELHVVVRKGGKIFAEGGAELPLDNLELWSPENPALYEVTVSAGDDEAAMAYGFRELTYDANQGMKLNGRPYAFRGLCMHHDLGVFGAAFHKEVMAWRLKKIKAIGCNALRTAHNPPDPKLLELCDEMGFLVMDEAFDIWRHPKKAGDYHNEFDSCHEKDLRDMLRRDRNHPCVALWSIGNEIVDDMLPHGAETAKELVAICHEEDETRPVTAAICHQKAEDNPHVHAFAEALDVIGFNYQPGLFPLLHQRFPSKPIVASETSAVVSSRGEYFLPTEGEGFVHPSGYNTAYATEHHLWSNDSESMFRTLGSNPWLLGEFAWCTFDYLGEPDPHPYPNRSSGFALFDLAGLAKDRAFLYAAQWRPEGARHVLHLLPHWNWNDGDLVEVHAFTSCASVELLLNGKSLGLRERLKDSPRIVWKAIPFIQGTLEAVGYDSDGKEVSRARRVTAGTSTTIGFHCDKEQCDRGGAFIFAELFMQDAQGNVIETSDAELAIDIFGGELIGVDNGDARCLLPFKRNTVKLYNGHAMLTAWADAECTITLTCGNLTTKLST